MQRVITCLTTKSARHLDRSWWWQIKSDSGTQPHPTRRVESALCAFLAGSCSQTLEVSLNQRALGHLAGLPVGLDRCLGLVKAHSRGAMRVGARCRIRAGGQARPVSSRRSGQHRLTREYQTIAEEISTTRKFRRRSTTRLRASRLVGSVISTGVELFAVSVA